MISLYIIITYQKTSQNNLRKTSKKLEDAPLPKKLELAVHLEETTEQKVNALIARKEYAAAADVIMKEESYAFKSVKNTDFYNNLRETGKGKDERDELFKKMAVSYGAFGEKLFQKADGTLDKGGFLHILETIQTTKKGAAFLREYEHGDIESFKRAATEVLKSVFSTLTIHLEE